MHSNNSKDDNLIEEAHTLIDELPRPSEESNSSVTTSPLEAKSFTNASKNNHTPATPNSDNHTDKSKQSQEKPQPQNISRLFQENYTVNPNIYTPDKMDQMLHWSQAHLNQPNENSLFPHIPAPTVEDSSPYIDRQYKSMECGGDCSLTPSPASVGTKSICSPNTLTKKSPENKSIVENKKSVLTQGQGNISYQNESNPQLELALEHQKIKLETLEEQYNELKNQYSKVASDGMRYKEALSEYERKIKELEEDKASLEQQIMGKPIPKSKVEENAKTEINSLRKVLLTKERKIEQLTKILHEKESNDNIEVKALVKSVDEMTLEVSKLKIINNQLSKELKAKEGTSVKQQQISPNLQMLLDEQILKNEKLHKENESIQISLEKALNEINTLRMGAEQTEKYIMEQKSSNNQEESQEVLNLKDEISELKGKLNFLNTTNPHNIDSHYLKLKEAHSKEIGDLVKENNELKQKLSQGASNVSLNGLYEWVGAHNAQEFDLKKEKIKEDMETYELLKSEFQKCQERITELEDAQKDYEELKQRVGYLNSIKDDLQSKIQNLEHKEDNSEKGQLLLKVQSLTDLLKQKELDIGLLEETKKILEQKEEKWLEANKQLKEQNESDQIGIAENNQKLEAFYNSISQIVGMEEDNNYNSLEKILQNIEDTYKNQIPSMQNKLKELNGLLASSNNKAQEQQNMITELQTQASQLDSQFNSIKVTLDNKESEVNKLNEKLSELQPLHDQIKEEEEKYNNSTKEMELLKDKLALLEEENNAKGDQFAKLQTQIAAKEVESNKAKEKLQREIKDLQNTNSSLHRDMSALKEEKIQVAGEIVTFRATSEQDKLELIKKVNELQNQIEEKQKALSDLKSATTATNLKDIVLIKEENKSLQEDLCKQKAETQRLNQLLSEARIEMNKMMSTSKKLTLRSSSESMEATLKKEQTKSQSMVAQYEETINKLNQQISHIPEIEKQKCLTSIIEYVTTMSKNPEAIAKIKSNDDEQLIKALQQWKESIESSYAKEVAELRALVNPVYNQQSPKLRESIEQLRETLQNNDELVKQKVKEQVEIEKKHIKDCVIGEIHSEIKKRKQKKFQTIIDSPQSLKQSTETLVNHTTSEKADKKKSSIKGSSINEREVAELLEKYADCIQTERVDEIKLMNEKQAQLNSQIEKQQIEMDQIKQKYENEISILQKQIQELLEKHNNTLREIETKKSEEIEQIEKKIIEEYNSKLIETLKEKDTEHEELLKLKEEELKSQINTQFMANYNKKKEDLTRQFNEYKDTLAKDFDLLKQQLQSEMLSKAEQLDNEINNAENDKMEAMKSAEKKAEDRIKMLEGVITQRKKELDDEYNRKLCETQRNEELTFKAQLEKSKLEYDQQLCKIQKNYETQSLEMQKKHLNEIEAINKQLTTLKQEKEAAIANCEREISKALKKVEKESQSAAAETQRKLKQIEDKKQTSVADIQKELQLQIDEIKAKHTEEKKKLKEEAKSIVERNKVSIKALKDQHSNDLIKKDIECQRESKKLQALIDQLKKDIDTKQKEMDDKIKEENEHCTQKIALIKAKIEKEFKNKELQILSEQAKPNEENENKLQQKIEEKYKDKLEEGSKAIAQLEAMQLEIDGNKRKIKEYKAERDKLLQKISDFEKAQLKEALKEKASANEFSNKSEPNTASPKQKENSICSESYIEGAKIFEGILEHEFEKILCYIGFQNSGITTEAINKQIALKLRLLSPDNSSNELLNVCMKKLNAIMLQFRKNIENKAKAKEKSKEGTKDKAKEDIPKKQEPMEQAEETKYIHEMDPQYSDDIMTKVSPIRIGNGKYVVDIEKVFKDLLLVRDSLSKIFKTDQALYKPNSQYEELFAADSKTALTTINDLSQRYRALLNGILRFAVEASWLLDDLIKKRPGEEEAMRLKLRIADLNGRLKELEKHMLLSSKGHILFIDLREMEIVKEGLASCKDSDKSKQMLSCIEDINARTAQLKGIIDAA